MTIGLPPLPGWLGQCRRYMDDAPGVRAECERNKGKCYDCPNKRREEINALLKLAVREALERAAVRCDEEGDKWVDHTSKLVGYHCAKTIRSMIEEYKDD